jgi:hypothetical protein
MKLIAATFRDHRNAVHDPPTRCFGTTGCILPLRKAEYTSVSWIAPFLIPAGDPTEPPMPPSRQRRWVFHRTGLKLVSQFKLSVKSWFTIFIDEADVLTLAESYRCGPN